MADMLIYNDIGDWFDGITASSVATELNNIPTSEDVLNVRINSLGGSVSDGVAIRNILRSFAGKRRSFNSSFKVVTIVDGFAYSAASIIAMAGDEIVMNQGSLMMIHRAWTWAMGNSTELVELSKYLNKIDGEIANLYASRTGKKEEDMLALMTAETYFTAKEAVAAKLADQVDETHTANLAMHKDVAMKVQSNPGGYTNLMKCRIAAAKASKTIEAQTKGNTQSPAPDTSWITSADNQLTIDTLSV